MKYLLQIAFLCASLFLASPAMAGVNYTNAELSGQDFSGQDLSGSQFLNVEVSNSNFAGSNLRGSSFTNVNFSGVDLRGADFSGSSFINCDFSNSIADSSTNFKNTKLQNTTLPAKTKKHERAFLDQKAIIVALEKPNSKVDLTVNFAFDSDKIIDAGHKQVFEIAQALKSAALTGKPIRIEGHTDSKGSDKYNMDLSYRRAVSVMSELRSKYEVDTSALTVEGYGETRPVMDNTSEQGRAINRRVTLVRL